MSSPHDTDITPLKERPRPRYQKPPGHRVIHAVVPEATFVHVHKMALESGMRFTHYLARFLQEAFPYSPGHHGADSNGNPAAQRD